MRAVTEVGLLRGGTEGIKAQAHSRRGDPARHPPPPYVTPTYRHLPLKLPLVLGLGFMSPWRQEVLRNRPFGCY